ncbi:hypothetical protein UC8_20710 [Roseimaritima ulvae]|uniref:Transmembrane protein n=2 Tax=Roseimaritima ulvae TaxID=980254 RepID=A0A5B9QLW1_9BACT|nr:hypothetical protein UC8_20710 [Roseimaritima ulvae]
MADLVARLGPPPSIIIEDWREQLVEWIRDDDRAAAKLSADRLAVDAENRLSWIERDAQLGANQLAPHQRHCRKPNPGENAKRGQPSPPSRAASQAVVQALLRQLTAPSERNAGSSATLSRPCAHQSVEIVEHPPAGEGSDQGPAQPRNFVPKTRRPAGHRPASHRPAPRIRRTILAAVSLAALGVLVWVAGPSDHASVDRSHHRGQRSEIAQADSATQDGSAVELEPSTSGSRPNAFAAAPLTAGELSNLDLLATDPASGSANSPNASSALAMQPWFPSATAAPTSPLIDATDAERSRENLPDGAADEAPSPGAEIRSEQEEREQEEREQEEREQVEREQVEPRAVDAAVRVRRGPAVSLPASDAVEHSVMLVDHPITGLIIQELASGAELELAGHADGKWAIQADKSAEQPQQLAWIEATASETRFRWTAAAATSSAARQLPNARLRIDSASGSSLLYLRPTIEIDPLPLSFNELDQRTAWSLGSPIAAMGSRLQIDLDLPDDVQLAWIEPPATQPPRRMRAVAQLLSKEDEFVALRIRWDIQAGVRLSCRQRTAARLDTSMPWQLVSLPQLSRSADQLIASLARQQQLLERLLAMYSDADYQQRKALRPRRDGLQQQVEAMSTAAERMSQLIRLMEQLEAEGTIRFELTTTWPDATQTILVTGVEAKDTP